jgi:hypothetical protein
VIELSIVYHFFGMIVSRSEKDAAVYQIWLGRACVSIKFRDNLSCWIQLHEGGFVHAAT